MKRKKIFVIALLSVLLSHSIHAMSVTCPEGFAWKSDGYCKLEYDLKKMASCPPRSKLKQLTVTSAPFCFAQGDCPAGQKANALGRCVELEGFYSYLNKK